MEKQTNFSNAGGAGGWGEDIGGDPAAVQNPDGR